MNYKEYWINQWLRQAKSVNLVKTINIALKESQGNKWKIRLDKIFKSSEKIFISSLPIVYGSGLVMMLVTGLLIIGKTAVTLDPPKSPEWVGYLTLYLGLFLFLNFMVYEVRYFINKAKGKRN